LTAIGCLVSSFLQVSGSILYNGHNKDEFVVERTTAFVDQVRHRCMRSYPLC
jgi:hypothetical protein